MPGRATSIGALGPSIHLVRHGEVINPGHLVYGDLPNFGLSELGRRQAAAAADHLSRRRIERVATSPLERAVSTAWTIGSRHGLVPEVDQRLSEWTLNREWLGRSWDDLPAHFPGQLEAYLADPTTLDFATETIADMGSRVVEAIEHAWDTRTGRWEDVVVVFHQDPMETARRMLTGRGFDHYRAAKPGHGDVISLAPRWRETLWWRAS